MRKLTLIPAGGLANRINAITSAIGFCRDNSVQLKVIWFKDWGMGADFHQILTLNPAFTNVEIADAKWYHWLYAKPRKGNLWIPALWQRCVFSTCINEFKPHLTSTLYKLSESLRVHDGSVYLISYSLFYEWGGVVAA